MAAASSSITPRVTASSNGLDALRYLTLDEKPKDANGLLDTAEAVAAMVDKLHELPIHPPSLYVHLEGVDLSRHGTISILQIHVRTSHQNYLVDVKTLGETAFSTQGTRTSTTLKAILESPLIPKVFFDIRNDSDALYSHYQIKVQGIQDLQLMELATRFGHKDFVTGLKKCIERDLPMTRTERLNWIKTKDEGLKLFAPEKGGSYEVFNERPLPEKVRMYCVQDVHFLPRLWDVYNREMIPTWRAKVEDATKARVVESQAPGFEAKGKHKTLAPEGWEPRGRDRQVMGMLFV
ncbi:ribonuclease H-like protein [Xylariaceae sp. FL1019]|nr:ribonuclease H-like protein [Xylariaceae sp. FL1019]